MLKQTLTILMLLAMTSNIAALDFDPNVGYIGLFVDQSATTWCADGTPMYMVDMYVMCLPGELGHFCSEFAIGYPENVIPVTPAYNSDLISISLGDVTNGISICYNSCQQEEMGWYWLLKQPLLVTNTENSFVQILPHSEVGTYQAAVCNETYALEPLNRNNNFCLNFCTGDIIPPYLTDVVITGAGGLEITFNEQVSPGNSEDPENYRIWNRDDPEDTIVVTGALLQPGDQTVLLSIEREPENYIPYIIHAQNIEDLDGFINDSERLFGYYIDLEAIELICVDRIREGCVPFDCSFRITNSGQFPSGPFQIRFSFSNENTNIEALVLDHGSLDLGDTIFSTIQVDLPLDLEFDNYLVMEIDPLSLIPEIEKQNNILESYFYNYNPKIISVVDVENDQGGSVRITFKASGADVEDRVNPITSYEILRRIDPLPEYVLPENEPSEPEPAGNLYPGIKKGLKKDDLFTDTGLNLLDIGDWELVGEVPATFSNYYTLPIPTLADTSINAGIPYFIFIARAVRPTPDSIYHYVSCPDSGYSIDNIPPSSPTDFGADQLGENLSLHWKANEELDLCRYMLHRGVTQSFDPTHNNMVIETPDTVYFDTDWFIGSEYYYKLCATDLAGNRSDHTLLAPFGMIATMLEDYSAGIRETDVEINWRLSSLDAGTSFSVLRAEADRSEFIKLAVDQITSEGLEFGYVDRTVNPGTSYRYRVCYKTATEMKTLFETEIIMIPDIPLSLFQNYPNPFNPSTLIRFYLPESQNVRLEIFDVNGRRISSLLDRRTEKGFHNVTWNGKTTSGSDVSSGLYFYRLTAGNKTRTMKLILLR